MGVRRGNGRGLTGRDVQRVIEYDTPIEVDGPNGVRMTITAIDANHVSEPVLFLSVSLCTR